MNGIRRWLRENPTRYPTIVLSLAVFGFVWTVGPTILPFLPAGEGQGDTSAATIFVFLIVISWIHVRTLNREGLS